MKLTFVNFKCLAYISQGITNDTICEKNIQCFIFMLVLTYYSIKLIKVKQFVHP